jgi:replicative DNA helicase
MAGIQLAKRSLQSRIYLPSDQWPPVTHKIKAESQEYWSNGGTAFVLETCRTIDRVEECVQQITSEYDVGMIVLDYVQLLRGKGSNRYEQVTYCSNRFAELARKHGMVGVLIAQLNRDAARGGAEIYSFKDSSQLEQDADVVLLIEWLTKTNPAHPNPRDFKVKIPKNRNRGVRHHEGNN